ncbi:transcription factor e [Cystoisospora suis]|uniref:Transcription factor e n=1 Tax=Cystoisospora suis TaxID=483139 RepID=A0A2C6L386_9APIC|nr:transcription factor e [Cystoisospora suis]
MAQAADGGACHLPPSGRAGGPLMHPSCPGDFSPSASNQFASVTSVLGKDRCQSSNFPHSPRLFPASSAGMNQFQGPPPGLGGGGGRGGRPGSGGFFNGPARIADFGSNSGNNNTPRHSNSLSHNGPPPGLGNMASGVSLPGPGLDFLVALAGGGGARPPKAAGQGGMTGMPAPAVLPPPFPGMFPPAFPPLPFPMPPNFAAVAAATAMMRCGTPAATTGADVPVGGQQRVQPTGNISPGAFPAAALQAGGQPGKGSQQGGASRTQPQTLKDILQANGEKEKLKRLVKEELRKEGYNFVLLNLATEKIKQKGGPEGLDEETMLQLMRNEGREKLPVSVKKLLVTLIEGLAGKDKKKEKDEEREKEAAAAAAEEEEAKADRRQHLSEKKVASGVGGQETGEALTTQNSRSESSARSRRSTSTTRERAHLGGRHLRGRSVSRSTSRSRTTSRDHVRSISHSHSPVGTLGRPLPETGRNRGRSRNRSRCRSDSRSRERSDSQSSRSYSGSSRGDSRSTSHSRSSSRRSRRHAEPKRSEEEREDERNKRQGKGPKSGEEHRRRRGGEPEAPTKEAEKKRKRTDGDNDKSEKKAKSRESEKKCSTKGEVRKHPSKHEEKGGKKEKEEMRSSETKDKQKKQKGSGEKTKENPKVDGNSSRSRDKDKDKKKVSRPDSVKPASREKSRRDSTKSGQSGVKRK